MTCVGVNGRLISSPPTMAGHGAPPYGMAATRPGYDSCRGQKTVPKCPTGKCSYCHKWIKCDMYCHVATYHLDLAQLWRCPVSWCTVWKDTPQDYMDHVRGRMMYHGTLSQPVWRRLSPREQFGEVWSDLLAANHSGISTDVLLLSNIQFSLTHHYRVHKRGLPHIAFRNNYLTRLHVSVSQAAGQSRRDTTSPVMHSPVSTRHACSAERESETSRLT